MTKFDICVFVGAIAGIRYNKHLALKNKDKDHE